MKKNSFSEYKNKNILITGGLGFLGSNLACELSKLGARVTILDSLHPLYGGNIFNIEECRDKVDIIIGDIRDQNIVNRCVQNKDLIFNLAAQVSYIDSTSMIFEDLEVNCMGHLNVLEAVRKSNQKSKVIFSSSRLVLGANTENPVTETHPTNPTHPYGIHKLTGEKYHLMYNQMYGIPTVILRITNPFGKRQQIKHNKYGIPGWFMRQAMEEKTITIFGDGTQLRDYICATDVTKAFLQVGLTNGIEGGIFNCGSGRPRQFKDMAEIVVKEVGKGKIEYIPWPQNYKKIETGDSAISISKITKATGWVPTMTLEQGISDMVKYYKKHRNKYID